MLEVRSLSRSYGDRRVLDDVSIRFPEGSFTIIAGPNGSGKTQLMRHLNGLLKARTGEILLEGEDIRKDPAAARRRIGLVFQNADSQMVGQTVASDIAFGPENLRWDRPRINDAVDRVLEEFSLTELKNRQPHTLSGGEKRRCVLAAVLVMRPDIIVLDEPFTGLDLKGVREVLEDLVRLHKEGKTVILITHDLEKALAHADRLVLMDSGKILADGSPEEMIDRVEDFGLRRPWGNAREIGSMTWL